MPTASEASAVEAPTAMEATDMGDAHTVSEPGASKMGYMGETNAATIHVTDATYAVAEAMIEAVVVGVAHLAARRFEQAIEWADRALHDQPRTVPKPGRRSRTE